VEYWTIAEREAEVRRVGVYLVTLGFDPRKFSGAKGQEGKGSCHTWVGTVGKDKGKNLTPNQKTFEKPSKEEALDLST